jgi:hypothetical protein
MLATSFGLNKPSSGKYLWKLKKAGAYSTAGQHHGIPFTITFVLYR